MMALTMAVLLIYFFVGLPLLTAVENLVVAVRELRDEVAGLRR